jgi:hypothetical protein
MLEMLFEKSKMYIWGKGTRCDPFYALCDTAHFARATIADPSCTHKWIKKSPSRLRKDSNPRSVPTAAESFVSCESPDHAALVIGGEPSIRRAETYNTDSTQYPRLVPHQRLSLGRV